MGRQRMPISHEKQAFMLMLEFHPVFQDPVIMPKMQAARRTHAR